MQVSTSCSHSELMLGLSSGAHTQRRDITRRTRHPIIFRRAPLFCSSLPYSPCWDQLWSTHTTAGHHTSYTSPYYLPSSTVILQQSTLFSMLGSALEHTHNGGTSHVVPYYLPSSTVILQQSTLFSMLGSALEHTHNGGTSHVLHVTLLSSVKHRYSAAVYPILHAGISSGAHTTAGHLAIHITLTFRQASLLYTIRTTYMNI